MQTDDERSNLATFMLNHIAAHGRLDFADWRQAWDVAMADGVLDERERRILHHLLDLLPPDDVPQDMLPRIAELRARYHL